MKKMLSAVLAATMILSVLLCASCEKKDDGKKEAGGTKNTSTSEAVDERRNPDLEIIDQDGYTFTIYGLGPNDGGDWHVHDIIADDTSSSVLDEAIYKRNVYLEDTYNFAFDLMESTYTGIYEEVSALLLANEEAYDDYCVNPYDVGNLAGDGLLLNFNTLPYLDLEQDYWAPSLTPAMSFMGRQYGIIGDISIVQKEGVRGFYFNKTIAADLQLPDIYGLVTDKEWTYDAFFRMVEQGTADLNGDGKTDGNDRYGLQAQGLIGMVLYQGSGEQVIVKDENDSFTVGCTSDRAINAAQKLTDLMKNNSKNVFVSWDWRDMLNRFNSNKALFYSEVMLHVETMRSYDVDFGIIPTPMYDNRQENYQHYISGGELYFHTLPLNAVNPERSAYILEVTAVASKYYVNPAFYDATLKTKGTRDEESKDMLDIIFSTYTIDLGNIYGFGRLFDYVNESIMQNGNIVKIIDALSTGTEVAIQNTVDHYVENSQE